MVTDLVNLAKDNELKYVVDIYPMYGSDVGAALKGVSVKNTPEPWKVHLNHGKKADLN